MKKKIFKGLLFAAKLAVAVVLMAWLISQVHWNDYVVAKADSKSYSIVAENFTPDGRLASLDVKSGVLWWSETPENRPVGDFQSIPGTEEVRRMGFASSIRNIKAPLLLIAAAGIGLSLLIVSMRWWMLLRIQDIHIKPWEAVRLTFLGQFFNAVVPGTVGGDLVKAWYVAKHTPKKAAILVSIFIDRVVGLTELTLLAGVMLVISYAGKFASSEQLRLPTVTLIIVVVIVILSLVFVLSRRFRKVFHLEKVYGRLSIARHFRAAGDAATLYRHRIGSLAKAVLITFGAHIVWVGGIAVIGYSLSLATPWYSYFLYIPLIYIIGSVPVSPGGVGLIENLYVVFFAAFDASPSMVLALALLARLIPVLWGLPGGIVAVTGPRLPKAAALEAEFEID